MARYEWRIRPLGELTENLDSIRVPIKGSDRKPGKYPYYGASGIVDYVDGYLFDGEYLLIAEDGENLRSRKTPIAFLARDKFWVNNHAHIVRGNSDASTRFLNYALANVDISGYLSGSTMPKLTQGNLNRIPILAPPIPQQLSIAHILGTLDDKIELNRRMNETLEAMARATFKSWFVDFDPIRAKAEGRQPAGMDAATAALFPDSFEDSPLGKIPKGWRVTRVGDVTLKITKGDTPTQNALRSVISTERTVSLIRVNAIMENGEIISDKLETIPESIHFGKSKRSILQAGDILYTNAGTIGRVALVQSEILPANTNQAVAIIQPNREKVPSVFLFLQMRQPEFQSSLHQDIVHAVQANLALGKIANAKFVLPPPAILTKVIEPLENFLKMIFANRKESNMVARIRDALLPKLLFGELHVPDAEAVVNERVRA